MLMAVKAVVSALFIVGINAIAQRNVFIAGWIASLPLVTVLSVGWLVVDQRGHAEITRFMIGLLWGSVPTSLLLVVTTVSLIRGASLPLASAIGLAVWVACVLATRRLGLPGI